MVPAAHFLEDQRHTVVFLLAVVKKDYDRPLDIAHAMSVGDVDCAPA